MNSYQKNGTLFETKKGIVPISIYVQNINGTASIQTFDNCLIKNTVNTKKT
jgi:hypothetical protein